jgi:hypothetical protein
MARLYQSCVRPGRSAVLAMLLAASGLALLLAVAWPWLGPYGELVFAGTILRGLLIGALLTWVAKRAHFSWPRSAAWIAGAATFLAILGSHYIEHRRDRSEQMADAAELLLISTGAGSEVEELREEYDKTVEGLSFGSYLRHYFGFAGQAKDGAAALWGPWAGLALYTLEVGAALFLATLYPVGQAREPICSSCSSWQEEEVLGRAAYGVTAAITAHLLAEETDKATELLRAPDTREHLELSLATCPSGHSQGGGVLRLREHFFDKRNHNLLARDRADLLLDQNESDAITRRLEAWA